MAQPARPQAVEEPAAPAAPAKKKSPMGAMIATALVVGPLAFGMFTMRQAKEKARESQVAGWEKTAPQEVVTYPLEGITVNLADGQRYCRVVPVLGFEFDKIDAEFFRGKVNALRPKEGGGGGEGGGEGGGKGKKKADPTVPKRVPSERVHAVIELLPNMEPQLKDAAIHLISTRKYEDLLSIKDRDHLKEQLCERFTEILEETKVPVKHIYFADFIMQ